jgi:hypothetical protein
MRKAFCIWHISFYKGASLVTPPKSVHSVSLVGKQWHSWHTKEKVYRYDKMTEHAMISYLLMCVCRDLSVDSFFFIKSEEHSKDRGCDFGQFFLKDFISTVKNLINDFRWFFSDLDTKTNVLANKRKIVFLALKCILFVQFMMLRLLIDNNLSFYYRQWFWMMVIEYFWTYFSCIVRNVNYDTGYKCFISLLLPIKTAFGMTDEKRIWWTSKEVSIHSCLRFKMRTTKGPEKDLERTWKGPEKDLKRTWKGPEKDLKKTWKRPELDLIGSKAPAKHQKGSFSKWGP